MEIGDTFRVLQSFSSEETGSEYIEGLMYTVRDENLRDLANRWISEGKIEPISGNSQISGEGFVL